MRSLRVAVFVYSWHGRVAVLRFCRQKYENRVFGFDVDGRYAGRCLGGGLLRHTGVGTNGVAGRVVFRCQFDRIRRGAGSGNAVDSLFAGAGGLWPRVVSSRAGIATHRGNRIRRDAVSARQRFQMGRCG